MSALQVVRQRILRGSMMEFSVKPLPFRGDEDEKISRRIRKER
jgi:hypothetical protein